MNTTRVIKPNQSVHLMRNFNYFWWNFFSRKVALCASVMLRRKLIRSCKYEFHNCKKNHNCFSIILARQSGHFSKYRYDSTGKDLILIILKVCHNFKNWNSSFDLNLKSTILGFNRFLIAVFMPFEVCYERLFLGVYNLKFQVTSGYWISE